MKSRFSSGTGDTIDHVYVVDGDILRIWAGESNSPACFEGTFSADGTLTGAWHYAGGVGYEAVSTRVE